MLCGKIGTTLDLFLPSRKVEKIELQGMFFPLSVCAFAPLSASTVRAFHVGLVPKHRFWGEFDDVVDTPDGRFAVVVVCLSVH